MSNEEDMTDKQELLFNKVKKYNYDLDEQLRGCRIINYEIYRVQISKDSQLFFWKFFALLAIGIFIGFIIGTRYAVLP